VKRIALFAGALLLAGCARKNIENKEAIRQAVVEYLNARQAQTGLDMSTMDVNVTAMAFEPDKARATVEFKVKNSDAGMTLNYTLNRKDDKWVVEARQDGGQGHGIPGDTSKESGQLPAGHPAIPDSAPASPKQ
jgi:outer membrane murein-binding lipoprotein Lpp